MSRQVAIEFRTHGGKRPGAGRPRGPGRRRFYPGKRPAHAKEQPVHVTLRVASAVGMLRRRCVYHAVRRALVATAKASFRVVHLSIQRDHVHLIVEADDREALIRGMQGFQISAARRLNAAISDGEPRRGPVFLDRYHARVLTSPRQVRNAIAYVLNNFRHHGGRKTALDPYASGLCFDGWKAGPWVVPEGYEPLPVIAPRTWLLSVGWRRHSLIDPHEVPGPAGSALRTPRPRV
jgi:REP element-mobilizing transposase RayT